MVRRTTHHDDAPCLAGDAQRPQPLNLGSPVGNPPGHHFRGRGAQLNPANRFESLHLNVLQADDPLPDAPGGRGQFIAPADLPGTELRGAVLRGAVLPGVRTEVFADRTRSIINHVQSPDIGFNWTLNPYRGCEHGCIYCYARPTHENLGLSSGLDFETRIIAKPDAPELLRKELGKPKWTGETIVMSGVTDCYQPVEAELQITRRCLQVMAHARQPVAIITKNRLILRDLDYLQELARHKAVHVAISVTTLDNELAAKMEPRASSPRDRLWAIRRLASAGIPVSAMVAPIIPGLNDREVPNILKAVADAGAQSAGYVLLRLPYQNKTLFEDWLTRHFPLRKPQVESLLRQCHGGELYDSDFGTRHTGTGPYARQLTATFELFARRYRLSDALPPLNHNAFRRPVSHEQLGLFQAA
ncbi:MAG: PA0069 family radical SAM protein [Phycisphaeraceae bacterium]